MEKLKSEKGFESSSELIRKAYVFAEKAHSGQKRLNGDDYFSHCVETAKILEELKLDEETIAAGLLHDSLEDTDVEYDMLKKTFGREVADLVEGVTKINYLKNKSLKTNNSETIRKMLVSATKDIRVIIIKLADRLHNMRTIEYLKEEKRKKFSRDTINIYSNLAYRLGVVNIKCELEDLAFRQLEPNIYKDFKIRFSKKKSYREKEIDNITKQLDEELKKHKLNVKILGRPKHFYSIYRKMRLKNVDFDKIYDLIGLRIITKNVEECYEVLGIIHNFWHLIPSRFKDYIANPKPNFYQSLHTGVLIESDQIIEIQIRTKEMEDIADAGIAAHWRYKGVKTEEKFDRRLNWLRQILDFSNENPSKFMKSLKVSLFGDNIFVFTPKGMVIELPNKATPVDFAYSIHSDVGDKCTGARVNGRFVSLRYELNTGDVIEILTSKHHKPSRDWLKFVRSSKALTKIKQSLKINYGMPARNIKILKEEEEIHNDVVFIEGLKNFSVRFSACCDPMPGDKILGYTNLVRSKVVIHRKDCKNISRIKSKILDVKWMKNFNKELKLRINASDRIGLLADILNTLCIILI